MRNTYLFILLLLLISCKTDTDRVELTPFEEFQQLKALNDSLINNNYKALNNTVELGRNIKMISLDLYNNHQTEFSNNEMEFLLKCAAVGSEASGQFKDAVTYFTRAQKKFPNSENAPFYLHNSARILDDILKDKNNARLLYDDLLNLYPKHPLSKNAAIYLENAFDKSEEELLDLINKSNN